MTLTTFFQAGLLAVLALLAGYAIPTLIQVRRTAKAMEDMVRDVQPRLVGATSNLDSLLGRSDRVMQGLEHGARGVSGAMASLSSFLVNLKVPLKGLHKGPATMAALANFLSGAWQAWAAFSKEPGAPGGGAASGAAAPPADEKGGSGNV